jgi:hypothetical protein
MKFKVGDFVRIKRDVVRLRKDPYRGKIVRLTSPVYPKSDYPSNSWFTSPGSLDGYWRDELERLSGLEIAIMKAKEL